MDIRGSPFLPGSGVAPTVLWYRGNGSAARGAALEWAGHVRHRTRLMISSRSAIPSHRWILLIAVFLLAAPLPSSLARDKTDVVILRNGDLIHGEIKELAFGRIRYSTNYADTIYVKWTNVVSLTSEYFYEVELSDGTRYYGSLGEPTKENTLVVQLGEQSIELNKGEVTGIAPIKSTFLERLDGSLNLGFNFTKSSQVAVLNIAGSATHRARKFLNDLRFSSNFTTQPTKADSYRADLSFRHTRFLKQRRLHTYGAALQRNDELGIDLRVLVDGGYGHYFVQSNSQRLIAVGGLALNKEWNAEGPSDLNLEGVLMTGYKYFRYHTPKADITVTATVFPGLTDWGRIRAEFDTVFRREMVKDFFWDIDFYFSFDSREQTDETSNDDWGIVTSVGYTF
jgi:hypothetical protein